jgi:flagellar hook-associated protein 1
MFSTSVSGLRAAQRGLNVTGHNIVNANTHGFSRQRSLQLESHSRNLGTGPNGVMQVGLGVNMGGIEQIRDRFFDRNFRDQNSLSSFAFVQAGINMEVENIFAEIHGSANMNSVLTDLRNSMNELSRNQSALETRGMFVSSSINFISSANNVALRMESEQRNLDRQVRQSVSEINSLVENIEVLNQRIMRAEVSGGMANDYRDARNSLLDRLSELTAIEVTERPNGRVDISTNGNELLRGGMQNRIGLKFTARGTSFVEPVFSNHEGILPYNANPASFRRMYNLVGTPRPDSGGALRGKLIARGMQPANHVPLVRPDITDIDLFPDGPGSPAAREAIAHHDRLVFNNNHAIIPSMQREFDIIVNAVVNLINDIVAPPEFIESPPGSGIIIPNDVEAPYDLRGIQSRTPVFVRKQMDRFDEDGLRIPEDPNNLMSLYTIGNIHVNPALLEQGGYNLIALSASGDIDDNTVVELMLARWEEDFIVTNPGGDPMSVENAYTSMITQLGIRTGEAMGVADTQFTVIGQIDNKRLSVSGVSMDEELANMIVFQHAYGASARMISVIDSMIEQVLNM